LPVVIIVADVTLATAPIPADGARLNAEVEKRTKDAPALVGFGCARRT
jgi:hypothetical protein